jgi:predicted nucleotidyltransferase
MHPTPYPPINTFLDILLSRMQAILGDKLVGLYLYGSLVTGDFDDDVSDIDLLAALSGDLNEAEFVALDAMQRRLISEYPDREHRLEIAYISLHALRTYKQQTSPIGIISPGEPFHIIEAGIEWLMNWHMVQEIGLTLFGAPPRTVIHYSSKAEFVEMVKRHAAAWREYLNDVHTRPSQAYAILTLCRALYTTTHGEQVSKLQAASWAAEQLPEWSYLIHDALAWRKSWRDSDVDHESTLPETSRFVNAVIDRIISPSP